MKALRVLLLGAILVWRVPAAPAQGDMPPAVKEVLKQLEDEAVEVEKKVEADLKKSRDSTAAELKKVQDTFCKDAKLDEAVAVRDLIRALLAGTVGALADGLPAAARDVYKQYEEEQAAILKKGEAEFAARREKMCAELKKLQDKFCKEAKLDEAVAVRDMIRAIRESGTNAMPDPGYVNNPPADIGKVFYYETTGVIDQSIYGTDVYTTGSHLGMAAVHCGLLKPGQRGIVKVTILPGQANYATTTRNGVTSAQWGTWNVSFKVERVYSFLGKPPERVPARLGEQKG
jgi:hypothetical protein